MEELKKQIDAKDAQLSMQADELKSVHAKLASLQERLAQENCVPDVDLVQEDWWAEITTAEIFNDVPIWNNQGLDVKMIYYNLCVLQFAVFAVFSTIILYNEECHFYFYFERFLNPM